MDTNSSPLWKQLLGAVAGAGVALLLYGGYTQVSPKLTAWIVAPQANINAEQPGGVRTNREVSDYEYKRFVARSQEIYRQFAAAVPVQSSSASQAALAVVPPPPPLSAPAGTGAVTPVRVRQRVVPPPAEVVREQVVMERADNLPSSGVGLWLGCALAGIGAAGMVVRRRMKHLSVR